ncbi:hypothetical protein PVAP13_2KG124092 [Panicum virgatum]|uniref:RING-type domain-containing protein n=1 Tax=Panicum virgatum TaxID=38727 RepID=A0A8T0W0E3_PANVG|nr:hypothetical protein PVAP13_2KG124092 [Panicum virgatum]
MVRSRDRTPSPPLHRRWGGRARTSPPATPPSPPSPAASSESSLPERLEHVKAAVMQQQQQISSLLLNLGNSPMDRNALIQACEEIDHNLCAQIQNTMELHQIISQHTDGLRDIIRRTSEMNYQLFLSQLPPVQGTAPESTGRSVICRVCYSRAACMLVLPCRHICACKSCEVTLTHCPICASTKANAVEVS